MGRFDALTQLEEQPNKPTSSAVVSSPAPKKPPAQQLKKQSGEEKNHEITKSGNSNTLSPTDNLNEKPLKYSTLINANLIKKIKLLAAERELKDYEVIEYALKEYFEKQK
jgi:hypothetical protein